jgi:signal transduction histidine kinase
MVIDIDGRKREENVLSENNAALAQQLAEQGKQLATDHGTLQMLVRTLSTELLAPLRRQENRIMNLAGKETCQTDKVVADLLEKTHLETGDMIRLINELAMRIDPQLCVPRRPAD